MIMKLKHIAIMMLPLLFITGFFIQPISAGNIIIPMEIGLYWDDECRNLVSSIDLGTVTRGHEESVTFWLKSQSSDKVRIRWVLANVNPSTDGIIGRWERRVGAFTYISNWHKKIKPGDVWEVRYTIHVVQDIQVGMYSWDLEICHTSRKSSMGCLAVACVLIVA